MVCGIRSCLQHMKRSELEDITREWISLWCAPADWELFNRIHSDDFRDMSPSGRGASKESFARGLRELLAAFPDLVTKVEDMVVDPSRRRVAVRWSATGTNRLRFLGVGPTNKRTQITGIEIIEISHGKVVRRWGEWDITAHR